MVPAAAGAEVKPLKVEKVSERLALRHPLILRVVNLPEWLSQEGNDFSALILYIDGMAFRGPGGQIFILDNEQAGQRKGSGCLWGGHLVTGALTCNPTGMSAAALWENIGQLVVSVDMPKIYNTTS